MLLPRLMKGYLAVLAEFKEKVFTVSSTCPYLYSSIFSCSSDMVSYFDQFNSHQQKVLSLIFLEFLKSIEPPLPPGKKEEKKEARLKFEAWMGLFYPTLSAYANRRADLALSAKGRITLKQEERKEKELSKEKKEVEEKKEEKVSRQQGKRRFGFDANTPKIVKETVELDYSKYFQFWNFAYEKFGRYSSQIPQPPVDPLPTPLTNAVLLQMEEHPLVQRLEFALGVIRSTPMVSLKSQIFEKDILPFLEVFSDEKKRSEFAVQIKALKKYPLPSPLHLLSSPYISSSFSSTFSASSYRPPPLFLLLVLPFFFFFSFLTLLISVSLSVVLLPIPRPPLGPVRLTSTTLFSLRRWRCC